MFQISDGVGCEACHGGGERWLGLHVSGVASHQDNWMLGCTQLRIRLREQSYAYPAILAMTKKLSPIDMGAGHPRLDFELDTFTATQPAHYEIDKDYYEEK